MVVSKEEEAAFASMLERGIKYLDDLTQDLARVGSVQVSGQQAFYLYDTLGFPADLTQIMCEEKGFSVDMPGFHAEMQQQKALAFFDLTIRQDPAAREVILDIEMERLLETVDLKKEAIAAVEESGIVFMDEIDKICSSKDSMSKSADASAEGVQRDLLPLVEGTTISTKYGNVNTDYILFIASGAFHAVKPSDMLPELQGRLPIRVELNGLTEEDLYKILTEPVANLLRQQTELLATEGVTLQFEDDAIREIARMAALLNRTVENIGARRLHTVIERIMESISFEAAEMEDGSETAVDKALVKERLSEVMVSSDLSRYIL